MRLLWCLLCLLLAGLSNWILPRSWLLGWLLGGLLSRLLRRSRLHWLAHVGLLVLLACGTSCSSRTSYSRGSTGSGNSGCTSSAATRCGLTGEHVQVGVIAVEKRPSDGGLRVETTEIVELLQRLAKIVEVFTELIRQAEALLNNRPRVVLDGLTPREVISGVIHDAMTA
ncbi:MAG: hypothetical protein ACWM05_01990 [Corynebacterium amycolatum]